MSLIIFINLVIIIDVNNTTYGYYRQYINPTYSSNYIINIIYMNNNTYILFILIFVVFDHLYIIVL